MFLQLNFIWYLTLTCQLRNFSLSGIPVMKLSTRRNAQPYHQPASYVWRPHDTHWSTGIDDGANDVFVRGVEEEVLVLLGRTCFLAGDEACADPNARCAVPGRKVNMRTWFISWGSLTIRRLPVRGRLRCHLLRPQSQVAPSTGSSRPCRGQRKQESGSRRVYRLCALRLLRLGHR